MLPGVEQMIREQLAELRAAEAELVAAQSAAGLQSPREIEDAQREVLAILADLRSAMARLPGPEANRVLSQLVDRVDIQMDVGPGTDCRWRGESRYKLTGGTIYLSRNITRSLGLPWSRTLQAVSPCSFEIRAA